MYGAVWSLLYAFTSLALGKLASKCFKLPAWVVPAIAFNNTTSLPLLLIKSLDSAGILKMLIGSDDSDAIGRAKSYFLVNAIVSNCLTFALGPKFLETEDGSGEDGDNKNDEDEEESQDQNGDVEQANGNDEDADETTSLLPEFVSRQESRLAATTIPRSKRIWHSLPPWSQETLSTLSEFLNAPFFGAVIGAILGLIPPLHKAFFADPDQGGIFKAWLTVSIQNIGDLFASLQIVVVGVNFASSLRKAKRGENSGEVPWLPSLFVLFIRFILWPALSIAIIWAFASRTEILGSDPMLWFAMMLMPTGPPALSLGAMCELTGATEMEKMSIAKFLVVSAYLPRVRDIHANKCCSLHIFVRH